MSKYPSRMQSFGNWILWAALTYVGFKDALADNGNAASNAVMGLLLLGSLVRAERSLNFWRNIELQAVVQNRYLAYVPASFVKYVMQGRLTGGAYMPSPAEMNKVQLVEPLIKGVAP